jgi:hypothetical protein
LPATKLTKRSSSGRYLVKRTGITLEVLNLLEAGKIRLSLHKTTILKLDSMLGGKGRLADAYAAVASLKQPEYPAPVSSAGTRPVPTASGKSPNGGAGPSATVVGGSDGAGHHRSSGAIGVAIDAFPLGARPVELSPPGLASHHLSKGVVLFLVQGRPVAKPAELPAAPESEPCELRFFREWLWRYWAAFPIVRPNCERAVKLVGVRDDVNDWRCGDQGHNASPSGLGASLHPRQRKYP